MARPTLLVGYGAYGATFQPSFDPLVRAWLDEGAVYAVAHVRGGGERGEAWHRAGRLETKPNTVADFVACAEHLIQEGWTRPMLLAGYGRSAGGIMIGGAITTRPDLFGAAVIDVGMTNALRFEQLSIGPSIPPNSARCGMNVGSSRYWQLTPTRRCVRVLRTRPFC
jgi:prolyl oligopeptidase